ncbi:MAG: ATP-binding protein, partial [Solirubrobacterales bacterium]
MTAYTARNPLGYPFSAVVGQDDYKLALLACAVDPAIGGVLALGDRGTAKTTLARSFAGLLPGYDAETSAGDETADGPAAAPFVELPLGATIDRVVGSVDTARLLAGEGAALRPGLIAAADRGVLYADEVNLLGDHLVDVLLDAAACGAITVERDGLSARLSARFVLIGTMNPDEGALRPQLLDRFGLSVTIESPADHQERSAITSRRLAYERDPAGFVARFAGTEAALGEIIARARQMLPGVELPEELLDRIARACALLGAEGMRADIVSARTALALAALDQRDTVIERDVVTAARLALPHRARASGAETLRFSTAQIEDAMSGDQHPDQSLPSPHTSAGRAVRGARHGQAPAEMSDPPDRRGSATGDRPVPAVPEKPAVSIP